MHRDDACARQRGGDRGGRRGQRRPSSAGPGCRARTRAPRGLRSTRRAGTRTCVSKALARPWPLGGRERLPRPPASPSSISRPSSPWRTVASATSPSSAAMNPAVSSCSATWAMPRDNSQLPWVMTGSGRKPALWAARATAEKFTSAVMSLLPGSSNGDGVASWRRYVATVPSGCSSQMSGSRPP